MRFFPLITTLSALLLTAACDVDDPTSDDTSPRDLPENRDTGEAVDRRHEDISGRWHARLIEDDGAQVALPMLISEGSRPEMVRGSAWVGTDLRGSLRVDYGSQDDGEPAYDDSIALEFSAQAMQPNQYLAVITGPEGDLEASCLHRGDTLSCELRTDEHLRVIFER